MKRPGWSTAVTLGLLVAGGLGSAFAQSQRPPDRQDVEEVFRARQPAPGPGVKPREPQGQVEVEALPEPAASAPAECSAIPPDQQLSCPLADRVVRLTAIPGGARLVVRGKGLDPGRIRAVLACQMALAELRRETPPACPFLAPGQVVSARAQGNQLLIDLVQPGADAATVGVLRERVETAFPGARRAWR